MERVFFFSADPVISGRYSGSRLLLREDQATKVREFQSSGIMSMAGLLIAWQIFPLVTDPLFSAVLWLVYPHNSYF
jgi:hypothetical protein